MPKIGVVFEIGRLEGGMYGAAAYRLLFEILDPRRLRRCSLRDGDTDATLRGRANRYCIALESPEAGLVEYVRERVSSSGAAGLAALEDRFIGEAELGREPLVASGRIGPDGELTGCDTSWVAGAWAQALERSGPRPAEAPRGEPELAANPEPRPAATSGGSTLLYAFMIIAEKASPPGGMAVRMRSLGDWAEFIKKEAACPQAEVRIIEPESWNPPVVAEYSQAALSDRRGLIIGQIRKSMDLLGLPRLDVTDMIERGFVTGSTASGRIFFVYRFQA